MFNVSSIIIVIIVSNIILGYHICLRQPSMLSHIAFNTFAEDYSLLLWAMWKVCYMLI